MKIVPKRPGFWDVVCFRVTVLGSLFWVLVDPPPSLMGYLAVAFVFLLPWWAKRTWGRFLI